MAQDLSFCTLCKSSEFKPRINVNTAELNTKLRSEYGTAFGMQEVQEMLLLSDRDLEDFESEIIRLKTRILYVEAQKKRLNDYKARLRSLLSLTRRLPNESLGHIFGFACDENLFQERQSLFERSSSHFTRLPALAISTVCKRWRTLAISSPSLWSRLRFKIMGGIVSPSVSSGQLSTLQLYLERSAECPLLLDVSVRGVEPVSLEFLTQHSRRWRSLKYRGDREISDYQEFQQLDFPILEHLNLPSNSSAIDLECFEHSPKLRSLIASSLKGTVLWDQLTFVDIIAPKRPAMATLLELCPNAVNVKLWQRLTIGSYSSVLSVSHRVSDKIRSLALVAREYRVDEDFLETVFTSLTLPSLSELHITAGPAHKSTYKLVWPKHAFNAFVSRSSCSITSLSIHRVSFSDLNSVITALRILSSLQELRLEYDEISLLISRLVSNLHGGLDEQSSFGTPFLPKLHTLSLCVGGVYFDDAAFVDMASSRWLPDPNYAEVVGVSCLRSVVLRFRHRPVDHKIYMPLQHLDKMGMRVVITGIDKDGEEEDSDLF